MIHKTPVAEADSDNRAREFYEHTSERLSFNGRPLAILDSANVLHGQEESAKLVNDLYFKLGSLLEELAYQSADRAFRDRRYELALGEIGLISEFVVQLAERNESMNVLPNAASEELYRRRGDNTRFWVGDFEYLGERVDFHVMIRPRSHEVLDTTRPGVFEESRQARLGVELLSRKYMVAFRLDPDRPICIDLDAPILSSLDFDDVNQVGHHFDTDIRISAHDFAEALNLYASVFDSKVEKGSSSAH